LGFPIPELDKRQRGRVERAVRHEAELVAEGKDALRLGIDGDPFVAGSGVDPADQTVRDESRVFRLEAGHPMQDGLDELAFCIGGGRVEGDVAGGPHRAEAELFAAVARRGLFTGREDARQHARGGGAGFRWFDG